MTTPYVDRELVAPDLRPDATPFWDAAREGRFLIKHCLACGKPHWFPRTLCPFCMGDTEWRAASGLGTINTFSVTRRTGPTPYCIAYVELEEGVTMMTNIVDCDLDTIRIGMPVRVVFKPARDGTMVPMFAPR